MLARTPLSVCREAGMPLNLKPLINSIMLSMMSVCMLWEVGQPELKSVKISDIILVFPHPVGPMYKTLAPATRALRHAASMASPVGVEK